MKTIYSALIPNAAAPDRNKIVKVLAEYPTGALRLAVQREVSVRPLEERESYRDVSPALRRLAIDVDAWPAQRRLLAMAGG